MIDLLAVSVFGIFGLLAIVTNDDTDNCQNGIKANGEAHDLPRQHQSVGIAN